MGSMLWQNSGRIKALRGGSERPAFEFVWGRSAGANKVMAGRHRDIVIVERRIWLQCCGFSL